MVELGVIEDLQHGVHRAGFRVLRSIDQAANARMRDGSSTHGTRFHRDVEITIPKTIVADGLPGFAECQDFGMSRGIVGADGAIATAPNYSAFVNYDGAHRHFAVRFGLVGQGQSFAHEQIVRLHARTTQ